MMVPFAEKLQHNPPIGRTCRTGFDMGFAVL
jgi:hypothetical protein